MNFDDIGDICSFSNEPKSKGLLTFYEEQWTIMKEDQIGILQKQTKRKSKNSYSKTIEINQNVLKDIAPVNQVSKLSFLCDNNEIKVAKKSQKPKQISRPILISKKTKASHSQSLYQMGKQKQNRIQYLKKDILEKISQYPRIKQGRKFESVHIQNYPFQEEDEKDLSVNKLKQEISNFRVKKGSSFKGFHRENISINSTGLNKEILSKLHKQARNNLLTKNVSQYEKYSNSYAKNVPNYLFPIFSPSTINSKKTIEDNMFPQYEDSLNKICGRIRLKQCRNSELPMKRLIPYELNQ